ncbi:HNH endonuclease [Martelella radicis]|uniref:Putative restriction endonuclease n=1 Tax=Martelella radicis TaxID=1397476 RepID=A0A7W6KRG6_9HYPH|nr:HNH endonuclease [Martelella radicis]MBB4124643.1 putative restriction endonuclease [Martelella radicis]
MPDLYVANTDNDWFDFLKSRSPLEDVNFWKPSPQTFKAIDEGQLFVFRLKSPRNVIGGYGVLASSINVPIQLAWDSLGERNGSPSMAQMITAIRRYRGGQKISPQSLIGCRVLFSPVFFEPEEWFPVPSDWSSNIVTGKVYNSETTEGRKLVNELELRTSDSILFKRAERAFEGNGFAEDEQSRYGPPSVVEPRLGQGAFRIKVANAYKFQCALSDTKVLPALEAAHIIPYAEGGTHTISNGIFLRKDIHSVLDAGFATITDDLRFHVSRKITEIFNNGNEYKRLHGVKLRIPSIKAFKPAKVSLHWHQENRFVGD